MNTHRFTRRSFLRGAGITMALPWMESFSVWGDEPRRNKPASEAPLRFAVTFSGNGFHSKEWWARGEGKAMEMGKVLTPLSELKKKMLFVRGLYHDGSAQREHPLLAGRQHAVRRSDCERRRDSIGHEL